MALVTASRALLTFPMHLGNTQSLLFILAWCSIFSSETVVTQGNHAFMFQVQDDVFIVEQMMLCNVWLSIRPIARSELGSDLDCSVINARSELGSDLDCYELMHSPHMDVAQVNPRCISVSRSHVLAETAHFEQFCCYTNSKLINTLVCPRYIWQI